MRNMADGNKKTMVRMAATLTSAAVLLFVAGCSGTPDASGSWEITVPVVESNVGDDAQDGNIVYAADLQQDENGSLSGSATATVGEYSCEYEVDEGSRVNEGGDFTLMLEGYCDSDASWQGTMTLELEGTIEGDEMTGEALNAMPASEARESLPEGSIAFADGEGQYVPAPDTFTGERGSGNSESELASSDTGSSSGGEQSVQSSHGSLDGPSTLDGQQDSNSEIRSEYETARNESDEMARNIESRLAALEEPQADLSEALGPDSRSPDIYDCASDPPSCVAASLEDYVEQDRDTFEEEGYNEAGCEAATGSETYTSYTNFDASAGEDYITERDDVEEAASGLNKAAREAHSAALDTEAARDQMIEAEVPGQRIEPTYSAGEVQAMVERAAEAEQQAMSAVEDANERYEGYKSRAQEAIAEAEALYARAGCAF